MIELVFLACSILHGAECKQIRRSAWEWRLDEHGRIIVRLK